MTSLLRGEILPRPKKGIQGCRFAEEGHDRVGSPVSTRPCPASGASRSSTEQILLGHRRGRPSEAHPPAWLIGTPTARRVYYRVELFPLYPFSVLLTVSPDPLENPQPPGFALPGSGFLGLSRSCRFAGFAEVVSLFRVFCCRIRVTLIGLAGGCFLCRTCQGLVPALSVLGVHRSREVLVRGGFCGGVGLVVIAVAAASFLVARVLQAIVAVDPGLVLGCYLLVVAEGRAGLDRSLIGRNLYQLSLVVYSDYLHWDEG